MKKIILTSAVVLAAALAPASAAKFAVGPKIGTLGIGLEATAQINSYLNVRAGVNYFKISKNIPDGELDYSAKLRLFTVGAFLDAHPFQNGFRVSAGAMYNGNKLDLTAKLTQNVTIDGQLITPAQAGNVKATVDFRKFAPYLGIGYDGAMFGDSNWSFNAEAGVLFQGKTRAKVTNDTNLLTAAQLDALKNDLQKGSNVKWLRFYPVVSVGLKYRF